MDRKELEMILKEGEGYKIEFKKELELLNSRLSVKLGEYDRSSPLIKEIEKNHVIIKGAEQFYEKIG